MKICAQGWNTKISSSYLSLLSRELQIPINLPRGTYAYDVCNYIYQYLQTLYIINGRGIGEYGKYLIKRDDKLSSLSNINKLSWELSFKNLVWDPKCSLYEKIMKVVKNSNRDNLLDNLALGLPRNYRFDIIDIYYALKYLGVVG